MSASCPKSTLGFKSPLRVVAWFLLRSRDLKAEKCRRLKRELDTSKRLLSQRELELERATGKLLQLRREIRQLLSRQRIARERQFTLPTDPPLKSHGYGARMVCLAVELAQIVGFRATERVLKVVFEWFGVKQKLPSFTTIRHWVQRLGVAALNESIEEADDWVWLADHSNQIGAEKVMAVLAIRSSELPSLGHAIKHEDVHVLTVQPGETWKKENVADVYQQLAQRYGAPRAVLMDGAAGLREGAEILK